MEDVGVQQKTSSTLNSLPHPVLLSLLMVSNVCSFILPIGTASGECHRLPQVLGPFIGLIIMLLKSYKYKWKILLMVRDAGKWNSYSKSDINRSIVDQKSLNMKKTPFSLYLSYNFMSYICFVC